MKSRSDQVKERIARSILRWAPDFFALELCRGILGREPGPKDLSSCATLIRSTGGLAPLAESLIHSNEFQRKTVTVPSEKIVTAVYKALLGREPDPEGLEICTTRLMKDNDYAAFIADVTNCLEFKHKMQHKLQAGGSSGENGKAARRQKDP
jgi:hypothetical protein